MQKRLASDGFRMTDHFAMNAGHTDDPKWFSHLLANLPDGITEIGVHPGNNEPWRTLDTTDCFTPATGPTSNESPSMTCRGNLMARKHTKNKGRIEQKSFWGSVLGSCLKGSLGSLFGGVLLVACGGIVNTCGIALRNASSGFAQKFIDTYYIRAANAEIVDCATQCAMIACLWVLCLCGMACGLNVARVAVLKDDINSSGDNGKDKKDSRSLQKKFVRLKIRRNVVVSVGVLCSLVFLYGISLDVFGYCALRDFNHSLRCCRCVIEEKRCQELDGMWVRMQSKADHAKIKMILDRYVKSADEKFKLREMQNIEH